MFLSFDHPHPTLGQPNVMMARGFGEDSITVSDVSGYQMAYITVLAYGRASNFSVLVSFDGVIQVLEGIPQGGSLPKV